MSELILSWLNDQLRLSQRVQTIQRDFKNGYLFAQILIKYNQQLNISQFANKDDRKSKLNNFSLLFEAFKSLRIKFDANVVNDIINQKQGVSKKLLYQLKMQLQKSSNRQFDQVNKSITLTPLKRISLSKQKKDPVDFQFFKKRLYEQHRAQKKINEDNVLKKFSDFHKSQIEKNRYEVQKEYQQQILAKQSLRNKLRNSYKKAAEFRRQWQRSNEQKWRQNMSVRLDQDKKDIIFQTKFSTEKKKMEIRRQSLALKQVGESIQAFQNKLLKNKRGKVSNDKNKELSQSIEYNQFELGQEKKPNKQIVSNTINVRIKKNAELQQIYRKQRDKRRRKMIVDQNKLQNLIQLQKRQILILSCINLASNQQKQLQYQIWKVQEYKNIIINNRKFRNDRYNQRKQVNQVNRKFKNVQMLKVLREQHKEDLKQKLIKQNQLIVLQKIQQRKQTYADCYKIISNIIDITQQCFKNQQLTNQIDIQNDEFRENLQMFLENKYSIEDRAKIQMNNYFKGQQKWKFQIQRMNSEPQEPQKQNSIPNKSINNYYLGNILKNIFERYYQKQKNLNEIKNMNTELGICVLGLQFAGKKLLSQKIATKYNLHLINIENIIHKRLQNIKKFHQEKKQITSNDKILFQACINGKQIPNQLFNQLIRQEIQNHPRFLLINYPNTYHQSILLTKILVNIQPQDYIQNSNLQTKIYDFSRLAKPTETIFGERLIKSCGVDLVVWIDIKPQISLNRCIGRRWIGNSIYHIQQDLKCDVNNLQLRDRGASIIEKNNFKLINLIDIRNWYQNFGIRVVNQHDTFQIRCWHQLNGEKNENQVYKDFENLVEKLLKYKQIQKQYKDKLKFKQQQLKKQQSNKLHLEQQNKDKCVISSQQQIEQKLNSALASIQLNESFINIITEFWNKIEDTTIQIYLKAFKSILNYKEQFKNKIASLKIKYLSLLMRSDNKLLILKNFQLAYNQFLGQNQDILYEDVTKQQLHQQVQDLEDQLLNLVEAKQQESNNQKNQIMNSGWLQSEFQKIYLIIKSLVVNEIQRSLACQQIISDYYSTMYSIEANQIVQFNNQLIIDDNLQIISNQNTDYPRISKLFQQAFRIFNKQQVQNISDDKNDKNKKGGMGMHQQKKEEKKATKKSGKQQSIEQKKEMTKYELELIAAINIQKSIFRYRMNILKQFSKKTIKNLKDSANKFYTNLEELLFYTSRTEIDAIDKIIKIFREKIQKQQKIQHQFQIQYVDIIISEKFLNFLDPRTIRLSAIESQKFNRFTISQLKFLIQNIKSESEKFHYRIINRKLSILLTRYTENIQSSLMFAQSWRHKIFEDYQYLISVLDSNNRGYVELKDIFTLFILNDCRIITNEEKMNYQKQLRKNSRGDFIEINNFCKIKAWFDKDQAQKRIQNINTFNRSYFMKSLLFEVIKDQDKNQLNIDIYLKTISFEAVKKQKRIDMTYQQFLFEK